MIRRVLHSAVTAYVIVALFMGFGIWREEHTNQRLCQYTATSWDERDAIVLELTQHNAVPKGVTLGLSDANLKALVANADHLKDVRRARLLQLQGERPSC